MQMIWMRNTNVINPLKGHHQSQVKLLKIKLFMKVVKKAIYVAVALFCLNLTVSAQDITLKVSNITVKQAMDELKSRSGYSFVFSSADVDTKKKISVSAENQSVNAVIEQILRGQGLIYEIQGKNIILKKEGAIEKTVSKKTNKITGVVLDPSGEPVIGANVVVKGSTNGTITDIDGNFSIQNVPENAVLLVSYIGFNTKEVALAGKTAVSVRLQEDTQVLDEVVVVGYGVTKKRDLTGAVGAVKMDENVISSPAVDAGQAIAGRVAGVQVVSATGRPGASSTVQIRGINSVTASQAPLVVVDGIQMPDYDLNLIPPSNIESIDILKDAASAAIYGSRGTNGVILITTKSGKEGKGKINFGYKFSIQQPIKKVDVMNSAEYAEAAKDAIQNAWIEDGGDPNAPNTLEARRNQYKYTWPTALDSPETLYDTDWQDVIYRNAPMHQVDLNYSWGNKTSNFSATMGVVKQDGVVITSTYQKYTMSLQASTKIKDWLQIGGMMTALYDKEREPFSRTVEWAVQYPSIYPVYGKDGLLGEPTTTEGFENYNSLLFRARNGHPLYCIDWELYSKKFKNYGNAFIALDIIDGLKFKTTFNYYINRSDRDEYQPKDHNMGPNAMDAGYGYKKWDRTLYVTSENLLTYNKEFGKHAISALAGYEANYRRLESVTAARTDYENDLIHYVGAGKTLSAAADSDVETARVSWFGRASYTFDGKYMLSASLRRDGSSRFGANNKWGYFPSVSGAWRLSDESFFKPLVKIANTVKIRASYGVTGNDGIADYSWIANLDKGKIVYGENIESSYYPSKLGNPDLKWERLQQLNIGVDLGFLQNRILLEADWYRSYCDGLLLNVPVPATSGFQTVLKNIGELENKGVELNLTTRNLVGKFQWQTVFNISTNKSKVLSLGEDDAPILFYPGNAGQLGLITQVDHPLYEFYGYNYQGVIMNEEELASAAKYPGIGIGYGKYEDVNNDGKIDSEDRTTLGQNTPKFIWGMTNTFKYKNFDLSFLIQGAHGQKIYDMNMIRSTYYHEGRNYLAEMVDRYRSPEQPGDGYHYKLNRNTNHFETQGSSYWLKNGSYIRFKNITLGYTLPKSLTDKLHIGFARLFVNGTNLFTITKYPGIDPESFKNNATEARRRGTSDNQYPTAKVFTMGINVEF